MKLLLDTHIVLWAIGESDRLSKKVQQALLSQEVWISSVTWWEISLKFSLGKLKLEGGSPDAFFKIAQDLDWQTLPLDSDTTSTFHHLPLTAHKDPFDRMLIWQAMKGQYTLLSQDRDFMLYQPFGLQLLLNETTW